MLARLTPVATLNAALKPKQMLQVLFKETVNILAKNTHGTHSRIELSVCREQFCTISIENKIRRSIILIVILEYYTNFGCSNWTYHGNANFHQASGKTNLNATINGSCKSNNFDFYRHLPNMSTA